MDTRTPVQRRFIMQSVKSFDTKPELAVRKLLTQLGYRYRLHNKSLPGKPDIVMPGLKTIFFVHGCFWHGHLCKKGRLPKSNLAFWRPKIRANKLRDSAHLKALKKGGWRVRVIWECQLKKPEKLRQFVSKAMHTDLKRE